MHLDLLVDPFDATWPQVRDLAVAAEEQGYGGVWTWDHLSGVVHGQDHVLEAWTLLSALAAVTSRVMLGPLVLNQANRDAGVVAQMAATLQEVSGGRLLLGLGAGTSPTGSYVAEQLALGRVPAHDPERRAALAEYIAVIRQVWAGTVGGVDGFLCPDPPPPGVVAVLGPPLAPIAGQMADGINPRATRPDRAGVATAARAAAPDPDRFLVTVFAGMSPAWLDPESGERRRVAAVGADRLILVVPPGLDPARLPDPGN